MSKKIIGYGELLLRLTPVEYRNLLEQSEALKMRFAGAEANVAADLALLGHDVEFMTILPDNPLGRSANNFLRKFGINTSHTKWVEGRLGTYYVEHGTSIRGSRITYDRLHSAFSSHEISEQSWIDILTDINGLILTGITPALSQECRNSLQRAVKVAKEQNVAVYFDLNYRRTLWSNKDAQKSFDEILPYVDVLFANIGSAWDIYNIPIPDIWDEEQLVDVTAETAKQLEKLGDFKAVAMTMRLQRSADDNVLGGYIQTSDGVAESQMFHTKIIDRLGGGDAFMAATIHGMMKGWTNENIVNFGAAAFAGTQTLHGDINFLTEEELQSLAQGNRKGFVKR
jgi:2-dehydro-3-deoxygluconokinase